MTIQTTYNSIPRSVWTEMVRKSPTGNWFQTPEAYEFFSSLPELFRPFVVGLYSPSPLSPSGTEGCLRGVCVGYITVEPNPIKQFATRRAIIVGGPALTEDCSNEEVETLMRQVRAKIEDLGGAIYIETRNFNDYSRWREGFEKAGFVYEEHNNFHIATESFCGENKNKENKQNIDNGASAELEKNVCLDSCPDGNTDSACYSHTSSELESVSINHNPEDESSQLSNQIKNCSVPTSHKIAQSPLIEHKMESLPTEHKMEPAVAEIDHAKVVNGLMGKNRVRDIKTSFRDGAIVIDHPTIEQVREYYAILRNLYTTKVKTPLFPLSFFEKLYEQKDGRFILVGKSEEVRAKSEEGKGKNEVEIIGGTVCVAQEGRCLYEWFVAGRDGEWKSIFPSSVATYAGIRYAAENGMPRFDMMGAGKPGDAYGVRDFKARFGGELVEQGRFRFIAKPLLYKCGELGVKLLKKIK